MNENAPVPMVANPFGNAPVVAAPLSALTSVDQQRAIAEVQAHMMVARAMPRDPKRALDALLNDCMIVTLAEDAVYQYSRGGSDIAGPSIKLAEAAARRWGNVRSGIEEISRGPTGSECRAYAWDLESGYYDERKFHVKHWRDTKKGGYQLSDERDIYELIANMGQRRKRAVLLSIIPTHVMDAAVTQCELTLKAKADTTPEGLKKLVDAFAPYGVVQAQIEARIQRRLEAITAAQVVGLKRVYASLRDGMSIPGDWFDPLPVGGDAPEQKPEQRQETGQPTTSKAERMRKKAATPKPQNAAEPDYSGAADDGAKQPGPDQEVVKMKLGEFIQAVGDAGDEEERDRLLGSAMQMKTADGKLPYFTAEQVEQIVAAGKK